MAEQTNMRARSEAVQRVQIGLIGIGAVLLVVAFANIVVRTVGPMGARRRQRARRRGRATRRTAPERAARRSRRHAQERPGGRGSRPVGAGSRARSAAQQADGPGSQEIRDAAALTGRAGRARSGRTAQAVWRRAAAACRRIVFPMLSHLPTGAHGPLRRALAPIIMISFTRPPAGLLFASSSAGAHEPVPKSVGTNPEYPI